MPTFRIVPRVGPSGFAYSVQRQTWCGWTYEFRSDSYYNPVWEEFKSPQQATERIRKRFGTVAEIVEWHP